MRWIFVALILLNCTYLGWEYWRSTTPTTEPVNQAQLPAAASVDENLVLLTERLPSAQSSEPPPPIMQANKPASSAPSLRPATEMICASVGPFRNLSEAEQLVGRLEKAGLPSQVSEVTEKDGRHWVLLPPVESQRRAMQVLRELQARKIDSYLISSGELKHAISLGLFAKEELAVAIRDKIREAGYPAEIRFQERSASEFWVRTKPGQPFEKTKEVVQSQLSGENGIKVSSTACETFALTR